MKKNRKDQISRRFENTNVEMYISENNQYLKLASGIPPKVKKHLEGGNFPS